MPQHADDSLSEPENQDMDMDEEGPETEADDPLLGR
jgi:hypothetical protein